MAVKDENQGHGEGQSDIPTSWRSERRIITDLNSKLTKIQYTGEPFPLMETILDDGRERVIIFI